MTLTQSLTMMAGTIVLAFAAAWWKGAFRRRAVVRRADGSSHEHPVPVELR